MMAVEKKVVKEEEGYKMEIKLLKEEENKLSFIIGGINPTIANTIRRIIIDEVPTLAIDEVTFKQNSSALYDEMIAHRLGLIPLITDLKSYKQKENCSCNGKGCSKCQVKFTLVAKGPGTVYSNDLKFNDSKTKPAYLEMPIVKLAEGQELELDGIAILGKGKQHSKFSPALAYYKYYPNININNKCDACGKCTEQCPQKILKLDNKKVIVTDVTKCVLCNACQDSCPKEAIIVKGDDKSVIFYIESWGQLKCREIIEEIPAIFDDKLEEFSKKINKL